jgi:3-deoxy-D-manno-octulosonate 8-phosphate phosphatase (KDO 8-P phosphatase)
MIAGLLAPSFSVAPDILARAAKSRLILFDVDGVLTDGRLILGDDGQEYKTFNTQDGHGIKMLQRCGVKVGVITGRNSEVVKRRMNELNVEYVYQGRAEKLPAYRELLNQLGIEPDQSAFVGDDVVDLPIMLQSGFAIAVQDAHALVKQHAHWVTPSGGGRGAAREVCELIMHAQGTYAAEMTTYLDSRGTGKPHRS